ncbi:hypothetical protein QFC22_004515 [Naganishia vaughanmartiniae]|uniref:Uncharacterized protein n=1 Tax=Naganishia vaughanmartiniae TaxID=1424756 RepID=A0ACC2WYL9_9TREE|nr:hypothetical protein QFC22_004515 [Naganishia vaughanmartiniae]
MLGRTGVKVPLRWLLLLFSYLTTVLANQSAQNSTIANHNDTASYRASVSAASATMLPVPTATLSAIHTNIPDFAAGSVLFCGSATARYSPTSTASPSPTATATFVRPEAGAAQGASDRPRTFDEDLDSQQLLDLPVSQEDAVIDLQGDDTDNGTDTRSHNGHSSKKEPQWTGLPKRMLSDEERISFVASFITETLRTPATVRRSSRNRIVSVASPVELKADRQKHNADVALFNQRREDFEVETSQFVEDVAQLDLDKAEVARRENAVEEKEKAQESVLERIQTKNLCSSMLDIVAAYSDSYKGLSSSVYPRPGSPPPPAPPQDDPASSKSTAHQSHSAIGALGPVRKLSEAEQKLLAKTEKNKMKKIAKKERKRASKDKSAAIPAGPASPAEDSVVSRFSFLALFNTFKRTVARGTSVAAIETPEPALAVAMTIVAPTVTNQPEHSTPSAKPSATLAESTKPESHVSVVSPGLDVNATVKSHETRAHAASLKRDLAFADAQTWSPTIVAVRAPDLINAINVSSPPVTNDAVAQLPPVHNVKQCDLKAAEPAHTESLAQGLLQSSAPLRVTEGSLDTRAVTSVGERESHRPELSLDVPFNWADDPVTYTWADDTATHTTQALLMQSFRVPAKPMLDDKTQAEIDQQYHALRTYRVDQAIAMRPTVVDSADTFPKALRPQTVNSPLIRPVTPNGRQPSRPNGFFSEDTVQSAAASMLRAAPRTMPTYPPVAQRGTNDLGSFGIPNPGPTLKGKEVVNGAPPVAATEETSAVVPPAPNRTAPLPVRTSVAPVGHIANGSPVKANKHPQARPASSYATVTSASLPLAQKHGPVRPSSETCQCANASLPKAQKHDPDGSSSQTSKRGSEPPSNANAAKLPIVPSKQPAPENPKCYIDANGVKKRRRGGRGSGVVAKAKRAAERLRLEAEQGGNGNVASEGVGDDGNVEAQVAGDGNVELEAVEAGLSSGDESGEDET